MDTHTSLSRELLLQKVFLINFHLIGRFEEEEKRLTGKIQGNPLLKNLNLVLKI